jgi:hypothetical protein
MRHRKEEAIMIKLLVPCFVALMMIFLGSLNARATDSNSCIGDVFTLCPRDIPDRERITACLRSHWNQVSPQCRSVMANYRQQHRNRLNRSQSGRDEWLRSHGELDYHFYHDY